VRERNAAIASPRTLLTIISLLIVTLHVTRRLIEFARNADRNRRFGCSLIASLVTASRALLRYYIVTQFDIAT